MSPKMWYQRCMALGRRRSSVVVWVILLTVLAGLLFFLSLADNPWEHGLESLPEKPAVKHHIVSGLFWAAWLNVGIILTLLLSSCVWFRTQVKAIARVTPPRHVRVAFWIAVAFAVLVGAWLGHARLNHSLWGNEEHTFRSFLDGQWEWWAPEEGPDELIYVQHDWRRAFFGYVNPNNHVLSTVVAKAAHELWKKFDAGEGLHFREWVLRLPGFIAALAGVVAMALAGRILIGPWAGVAAAWLYVLHPWFLRYSGELRGYAYALLFIPLLIWLFTLCFQNGRWWQFLALGLCEFLLLWAYPGALHLVILLNLGFVAAVGWGRAQSRLAILQRLLVGTALGAMLLVQAFGPCLTQLWEYLHTDRASAGLVDWQWAREVCSLIFFGTPWTAEDLTNPLLVTVMLQIQAQPFLMALLLMCMASLAAVGVWVWWSKSRLSLALCIPLLVAAPATALYASRFEHYLYTWDLVFALPGLVLFCAAGLWKVRRWIGQWNTIGSAAVVFVVLLLFGWGTQPQRRVLLERSTEAQRESVQVYRQRLGPFIEEERRVISVLLRQNAVARRIIHPRSGQSISVSTGGSHDMIVPTYDPVARFVEDYSELQTLMRRADDEGIPLFVNLARPSLARLRYPEVMAAIDSERHFQLRAQVYGLEEWVTRFVYEYLPGSVDVYADEN
ncbi:MAG: ArnT family glycosyltransferase [Verrucomicrobiales bacterium]